MLRDLRTYSSTKFLDEWFEEVTKDLILHMPINPRQFVLDRIRGNQTSFSFETGSPEIWQDYVLRHNIKQMIVEFYEDIVLKQPENPQEYLAEKLEKEFTNPSTPLSEFEQNIGELNICEAFLETETKQFQKNENIIDLQAKVEESEEYFPEKDSENHEDQGLGTEKQLEIKPDKFASEIQVNDARIEELSSTIETEKQPCVSQIPTKSFSLII